MNIKTWVATAAGIFALVGTVWGSVTILDQRYELKVVHAEKHDIIASGMDTFSITLLKREIRELRELIEHEDGDPDHIARLQADLDDAIDRLCDISPDDRECKDD